MSTAYKYRVKDTDGEGYIVTADEWIEAPTGLSFRIDGKVVARFSRWANFTLECVSIIAEGNKDD